MTQFLFILEPRLIPKTLCFTNQAVIYYSNFIPRFPKISTHFSDELSKLVCAVTWATLKKTFTFTELEGQREATFLQTMHGFS